MKEFKQQSAQDRSKFIAVNGLSPVHELLSSVVEAVEDMQESDRKSRKRRSEQRVETWKLGVASLQRLLVVQARVTQTTQIMK